MKNPQVAIIMRSKNEQPYTDIALANLFKQSYPYFELYNVDSGSTDGTLEVIANYNTHNGKIVEIKPEDYIPGKVLNDSIARTSEEIIVFLNADAIPLDEFWLEKLLAPILNGSADATMSKQMARNDALFIVKYDYLRAYKETNDNAKNGDFFSAVACAFKREVWVNHKFYAEGYAEDLEWAHRIHQSGYRITLVNNSLVEHSHNYSLNQLFHKKYRHGLAYHYIYHMQPNLCRQIYQWTKEIVRDFIFSLKKGKLHTIPYNLLYRTYIHIGFYLGKRDALRSH